MEKLNIYLLTQNDNNDYDTYDSIIVCAKNPIDAKSIDPYGEEYKNYKESNFMTSWAKYKSAIKCKKIGVADNKIKRGVVLASYNAG